MREELKRPCSLNSIDYTHSHCATLNNTHTQYVVIMHTASVG